MAIRYIFRRLDADKLDGIEGQIPDLKEQLGIAGEDLRRTVTYRFGADRSAQYHFAARKVADGWKWVCPTVELVADDEQGLFGLTDHFGVQRPSYLRQQDPTTQST